MDEYRKRFWVTFEQIQEEFDRFFTHCASAKRPSLLAYSARWVPACNVYDTGESLRVLVEIAGMRREALDLRVEEDRLVLRGTRDEPDPAAHGNYQQMEIAFGEFELEVPLVVPVDVEHARAWYRDGFLMVEMPKSPVPKPVRITIAVPEQ